MTNIDTFREELGLSVERGKELVRITQSIMDQDTPNEEGYGRTSHVLLSIAGRKDLNDVEKVACTFIFTCKIKESSIAINDEDKEQRSGRFGIYTNEENLDGCKNCENSCEVKNIPPIIMDINGPIRRIISGRMITPSDIDPMELADVLMISLISLLGQLPKTEAKNFCRAASINFARMSITGDMEV